MAIRGYYSSIRTATSRLLLNVNSITAVFYLATNLSDLIDKHNHNNGPSMDALQSFLKFVRVKKLHLPKDEKLPRKTGTVFGIAGFPQNKTAQYQPGSFAKGANASTVTFLHEQRPTTVTQYFKDGESLLMAVILGCINTEFRQHMAYCCNALIYR